MKTLSLIALLVLVTAAGMLNTQRTEPVAVGETAPDFTLGDQNGNKFTLSDSRRKSPVVLVFYRASW